MTVPYIAGYPHPFDISKAVAVLEGEDQVVLLETGLMTPGEHASYLFRRPVRVITADSVEDLTTLNSRVEDALSNGFYLAGWWCYESGYALEPRLARLAVRKRPGIPFVWLGVFDRPLKWLHGQACGPHLLSCKDCLEFTIGPVALDTTRQDYLSALRRIKDFISEGHTYQVNYTVRGRFRFRADPVGLYIALRQRQAAPYSAFIRAGDTAILSLSPELFLRLDDGVITMRPMKGTARRGRDAAEDLSIAGWLTRDVKNRAENVMIVDLIRNDLGRIAKQGTVRVQELFRIERYQTLFQMTSTVKADIPHSTRWDAIFSSLFPSGSVTGAPKLRTMEIISELETSPRGVYTGAIGFISPYGQAVLNVAIRTVVLRGGEGEIGIGSGITADSDPDAEYDECLLKSKFLTDCGRRSLDGTAFQGPGLDKPAGPVDFSLIETIRFDRGYYLLESHLERLESSAHYFSFRCDKSAVRKRLLEMSGSFFGGLPQKVRVLLERSGNFHLNAADLRPVIEPVRVIFSQKAVDSKDVFLYHKTTFRPLYEDEHGKALGLGFFDCIFINEKGEVTEGAITNVFLETGDGLVTPPVSSGLLDGTLRKELICRGVVKEKIIYPDELKEGRGVYVGNSVRGLLRAALEFHPLARGDGNDSGV